MNKDDILKNTAMLTAKAVAHYWETRAAQRRRQEESGMSGSKAGSGRLRRIFRSNDLPEFSPPI